MIILKELQYYSKEYLENKFKEEYLRNKLTKKYSDFLNDIFNILTNRSIIKYDCKGQIQFVYVGIIIVKEILIFVLPKYLRESDDEKENITMKKVFKLLNHFTEKKKLESNSINDIDFGLDNLQDNLISIVNFLLQDYMEYGIYKSEIESYELNGNGDINWCKTIDEIDPIVINNQWFYSDVITNETILDEDKFITLLHGKIINDCLKLFEKNGLSEFLNYQINIIESTIDDLDDIDRLKYEINKELSTQFNDRKRRVLYAIQDYLNGKTSEYDNTDILLYGTRNFKWIWEVLCGYVFDNQFINDKHKNKYETYKIKPPIWSIKNKPPIWNTKDKNIDTDNSDIFETKKNRLTPDILKVFVKNNQKYLLILDAKYYNMVVENEKLKGNPGISDITKQYLYYLALEEYISDNKIDKKNVINAFLFPTEYDTDMIGKVSLDFMNKDDYDDINLIQLNVNELIDMYCNNQKYNPDKFIDMIIKYKK